MEQWKDIPGYEGKYQVSNIGRVKSILCGKIMKQGITKNGYSRIILSNGKRKNQTSFFIHRLVGLAFLERNNLPQINHKDGNKLNNIVENLEWCTNKHNIQHAVKTGLKPPTKYWLGKKGKDNRLSKLVGQFQGEKLINTFYGISEAGRILKLDISDISKACLGKKKQIKGFTFKYL